jgi:hypothetical protein
VPPETGSINCLNFLPRTIVPGADAIHLTTDGGPYSITLTNLVTGVLTSTGADAEGIYTFTNADNSPIIITNSAPIATLGVTAEGIYANAHGDFSPITITNSGPVATAGDGAAGILAFNRNGVSNSGITIVNSGPIATIGALAYGARADTDGDASPVTLINSGPIATLGVNAIDLFALTRGNGSDVTVSIAVPSRLWASTRSASSP